MKLTEAAISRLMCPAGKKDRMVSDDATPGLYVRITIAGTRTFLCQWTDPATKRKQREPLGVWGAITLEQARSAAQAKLGTVAKGINPRAERVRIKADADRERADLALTFDVLVKDWATLHLSNRRPRYAVEAERAIRLLFADLLKKPAARISRADIINRLDKLVTAGKAVTAGRTLAYARAAFSWAMKRGKLASNPFSGLPVTVPTNQRARVLTDAETREIWAAAGKLPKLYSAFYRLALLTLARRDEVAGMKMTEIAGDVWTIPATRTKNGKAHTVHLSKPALDVLATVEEVAGQDLVFSTTGTAQISGFSFIKRDIDKQLLTARQKIDPEAKPLTPWVLHDFRRAGVTALAAMGFDIIVADKLLNHQPSKLHGAGLAYQRHDFAEERARALDAWAALITGTEAGGNVIKLVQFA